MKNWKVLTFGVGQFGPCDYVQTVKERGRFYVNYFWTVTFPHLDIRVRKELILKKRLYLFYLN
jgi:hypothetical protein